MGGTLPIVINPGESTNVDVVLDDVEERDYDELIQLYSNDPDRRLHNIKVTANRYSPNYIVLNGSTVEPGDTLQLQMALSNNDVVNGLQFDMSYDTNCFELLDKYEWSERTKGFTAASRSIGKADTRFFCYSLGGNEIAKGDGGIMTILFLVKNTAAFGAYEMKAGNILLSTPGLTNKYSGAGNTTTINVVKPVRTVSVISAEHGSVKGAGTYDLGAAATLIAVPDEGYSFVAWSDGNTDNPRTVTVNGNISFSASFTPNSYTIKYVLDGKNYKTVVLEYGAAIVPEDGPAKEGYTFGGWSDIPETMPAHDVTVTGSFVINSYSLKYIVDGEDYKTVVLEYGAAIVPENSPAKEGYTFGGWSDIPETMPAHDVIVTGDFSINIHKVTWKIDGEIIAETEVEYDGIIVEPEVPVKDGYEFEGWEDIPQTMPDHDITINGKYKLLSVIARIMADNDRACVHTTQGILVGKDMTLSEIMKLPRGVYIINGKTAVKK